MQVTVSTYVMYSLTVHVYRSVYLLTNLQYQWINEYSKMTGAHQYTGKRARKKYTRAGPLITPIIIKETIMKWLTATMRFSRTIQTAFKDLSIRDMGPGRFVTSS